MAVEFELSGLQCILLVCYPFIPQLGRPLFKFRGLIYYHISTLYAVAFAICISSSESNSIVLTRWFFNLADKGD